MDNSQPGVIVNEHTITSPPDADRSALPLFIGYSERHPAFTLQAINDLSEYEKYFGGADPAIGAGRASILYYAVKHYFDNGGSGGFVLSLGSYAQAHASTEADIVEAFADPRIASAVSGEMSITLLMIPDMVLLSDLSLLLWQRAWQTLLSLCRCRIGLFALLETPDDPASVRDCLTSFIGDDREWGAAYWPRLQTDYSATDTPIVVPASAAIAAVMESVDEHSGIWVAPANRALAQVVDTTYSYLWFDQHLVMGGASFNLIRSFAGRGTRVWGCRTLSVDANSPMQYVQVRRLLSYIEVNLSQIARIFMFEPNNELTWFKVKGQMCSWLRNLWLQGGLYGTEQTQAFEVALGLNETMTEEDLRAGLMIVKVRLSSMYPAEFIELSLQFDMSASTAG